MSVLRDIAKQVRDAMENRERLLEKAKDLPVLVLQAVLVAVGRALQFGDGVKSQLKRFTGESPDGVRPAETEPAAPEAEEPKAARREPVIFAPPPSQPKEPRPETPTVTVAPPKERPAEERVAEEPAAAAPEPEAERPAPAGKAEAPAEGAAPAPAAEVAEPFPGFSEMSLPSLRARLRGTTAEQVQAFLDYERAHANRPDVVGMFERRLAKLRAQG
ncbi:hypothetical protein TBS_31130 [Thermobispora bispora]|uniref:DUF8129 domain-containing protein n=1 Tax=Thermobispora bispora (strain ATCC 19993 / DSM 43833 / CBS 139.67 / JCM 10125 / KCTC 9307 / NBRC 14880 / R51) TaxID=469371 RepID=D6Y7Q0_THEBD|nr:hypothetical protein [Thermobispora bispora]ADG89761.1 hypothetical protein Tbis_3066 [Thermobispora bispora DSM 43833]MBO2473891.1 hypothetical protein [Actinomycetales bacterium]MBX6166263.1 hypothetical protein [Thermobispora bispora]QSI49352.1 hypothetical protein CYL17_17055 [Thermobispora bispora]